MSEQKTLPFQAFSFTLIENKRPRTALRLTAQDDGLYELQVTKGSAANPSSQFTRQVPLDVAQRLGATLQEIGVHNWESAYGDTRAPGSRRWTLSLVFKEGVFVVESKGGSDVPAGFEDLLEELYRLDFPRPAKTSASGVATIPTSRGDLAAFASQGGLPDLSALANLPGMPDIGSMNVDDLQQQLKEEFAHMSPAEQNQMIDMLVSSGMGTREFWRRFFQGGL